MVSFHADVLQCCQTQQRISMAVTGKMHSLAYHGLYTQGMAVLCAHLLSWQALEARLAGHHCHDFACLAAARLEDVKALLRDAVTMHAHSIEHMRKRRVAWVLCQLLHVV